jgi:N-acetylmuramic acid 6-phosphate etherase
MILNMLSTGIMVRLGKTYGNLMVDVQASNAKLRRRAVRLVTSICNIDDTYAQFLLSQSDWQVKTAAAAFFLKCSPDEARNALEKAGGFLRKAIEQ